MLFPCPCTHGRIPARALTRDGAQHRGVSGQRAHHRAARPGAASLSCRAGAVSHWAGILLSWVSAVLRQRNRCWTHAPHGSLAVSALTVRSLIHSALSSVQVWGRVRRHSRAWTSRRPVPVGWESCFPTEWPWQAVESTARTGLISGLTCTGLRPAGPEVSGEVRAGLVLGLLHFRINLRQLVNSCKGAAGARQERHQVCCGCGAAVLSAVTV